MGRWGIRSPNQSKQSYAAGIQRNPSHVAIVVTCFWWCLTQSQCSSNTFTLQQRQTRRRCNTSLWVDAEDVGTLLPNLWQTKDSLASVGSNEIPTKLSFLAVGPAQSRAAEHPLSAPCPEGKQAACVPWGMPTALWLTCSLPWCQQNVKVKRKAIVVTQAVQVCRKNLFSYGYSSFVSST